MDPYVTVVVLNYNREQFLLDCINSLINTKYPLKEIIVVDNNSSDQSVARITKEFPNNIVLHTGGNLGYSGGMNLGLRYAIKKDADYILILNSDTLIEKDTVNYLIEEMEKHPNAGAASGTIYYYPDTTKIWYAGGDLVYWRASAFTKYRLPKNTNKVQKVTFISGCAILFKAEMLKKVGCFDDRYFMFNEDAELSSRLIRNGYDLLYVPKAKIFHKIKKQNITPNRLYYSTRNRLLFLETAPNKRLKNIGFLYFLIVFAFKLIIWMIFSPSLFKAASWGIIDYFEKNFYEGRGLKLNKNRLNKICV